MPGLCATGKGPIGTWGFVPWGPTVYLQDMRPCATGSAANRSGATRGAAFEDLPENYVCPICGLDPKITSFYGPVGKSQFEPILDI